MVLSIRIISLVCPKVSHYLLFSPPAPPPTKKLNNQMPLRAPSFQPPECYSVFLAHPGMSPHNHCGMFLQVESGLVIPFAAFHGGLSILKGWLSAPWDQRSKLNRVRTVGSLLTAASWCWVFVHPARNADWNGTLRFETSWCVCVFCGLPEFLRRWHLRDCIAPKSEGLLMREGSLDCTRSVAVILVMT